MNKKFSVNILTCIFNLNQKLEFKFRIAVNKSTDFICI